MSNELKTRITTGEVRLSFPKLAEPRAGEEGKPGRYEAVLIIDKDEKDTIKRINNAIDNAIEAGASRLAGKKVKKRPLKDGDDSDREEYEGCMYLNSGNTDKPKCFDVDAEEMIDKEEIRNDLYAGCYVKAVISFRTYNHEGKVGVSVYLHGIKKTGDGDRLAGSSPVSASDFDDDDV